MTGWLDAFHSIILTYHHLAGPIFGLLVLAESLVLLGIVIPATPFLFLVGTLIGSGRLDPLVILPWAMAGAAAGYLLSWQLGRQSGHRIYRAQRFRPHRRDIARTRLFFRRWGGPSLVLGRYALGPFQSFVPFVAGVGQMTPQRFHLWNGLSSVLWVLIVLLPGYLIGRGITLSFLAPETQAMLTIGLLLLSLGLVVAAVAAMVWRLVSRTPTRRGSAR